MLEYIVPIIVIIALVIINGLFVAAEFALVGAKPSRIATLAEEGNAVAKWLLRLFGHPLGKDSYIAVAQLGITLASIGLGMYGEPAVAKWLYGPLHELLGRVGYDDFSHELSHTLGFIIALSFITYLHVVLGEMIPKALALQSPVEVSIKLNPLMRFFGLLFRPMVTLLNAIALGLMRLLRIPEPDKNLSLYTSQELAIATEEVAHSGQLNQVQTDLLNNIFELEERTAVDLMTSRSRMDVLSVYENAQSIAEHMTTSNRSRYPVYEDHLDQIIGVLHIKDFIRATTQGSSTALGDLVRPLPSVAATATAEELLALFKRERLHAALVVDEFGGTLGFVTMNDLITNVMDEEDNDKNLWVKLNDDGSLTLDGEVTLSELRDDHDMELEHPEVNTVAGLFLAQYGTVPEAGSTIHVNNQQGQNYDLTAEEVQGLKVMRVRLRKVVEPESQTN